MGATRVTSPRLGPFLSLLLKFLLKSLIPAIIGDCLQKLAEWLDMLDFQAE
jgi:hypothetical protein